MAEERRGGKSVENDYPWASGERCLVPQPLKLTTPRASAVAEQYGGYTPWSIPAVRQRGEMPAQPSIERVGGTGVSFQHRRGRPSPKPGARMTTSGKRWKSTP